MTRSRITGKSFERRDGERLPLRQVIHPRLAHEPRQAVDLGAARAATGRLAIPADGQVAGLAALDFQHRVEDNHPGLGFYLVGDDVAVDAASSPDVERALAHAQATWSMIGCSRV